MPPQENFAVDSSGKALTDEELQECVEELRNLIKADKKFTNCRSDDAYLLRYLHCTHFDVEKAFKRFNDHYDALLEHPEWFPTCSPLDVKELIDLNIKAFLPGRDIVGRPIFLAQLRNIDTSKTNMLQMAHTDALWMELVMDDPETQANGISILMDTKGYSLKLVKWLTPSNLRVGSKLTDLYPLKQLVYHIVNTSTIVNASLKICWPFLSAKIKEGVKFHQSWESLHQYINPQILPPEYGGTGPPINFEKLNQRLYDKSDEIAEKMKYNIVKKT